MDHIRPRRITAGILDALVACRRAVASDSCRAVLCPAVVGRVISGYVRCTAADQRRQPSADWSLARPRAPRGDAPQPVRTRALSDCRRLYLLDLGFASG